MNSDYMNYVAFPIVTRGDIQGSSRFYHGHHETLRMRCGSGVLFNDFSLPDDLQGLLSSDPSFVGPEEGMVSPFDPFCLGCRSDVVEFEAHDTTTELFGGFYPAVMEERKSALDLVLASLSSSSSMASVGAS